MVTAGKARGRIKSHQPNYIIGIQANKISCLTLARHIFWKKIASWKLNVCGTVKKILMHLGLWGTHNHDPPQTTDAHTPPLKRN